jgi:prolyl-tRNA editing enzyme YbaK/EbsC (Cys-tRNA(Pro) deacylase)
MRRHGYDPALMRIAGTLDWQPAVEHPELLAPVVAASITALDLDCQVAPIDPGLADTAAFCAAYGVPPEISANCVVVAGRRGEVSTMAACMVLATHRADVNKTVRKHLDVRKISFASMEEAVARTGMEYGGITPIGLPDGWPILVDSAAVQPEWVVIGSGIRGSKIILPGSALTRLPSADVLELAQPAPSG